MTIFIGRFLREDCHVALDALVEASNPQKYNLMTKVIDNEHYFVTGSSPF